MDFAYYNPSDESRSCVVRTMTKLTGREYQTVKNELTALAQEMGYPEYNEPAVFERCLKSHGFAKCAEGGGLQVGALRPDRGIYCVFCTNQAGFYHLMPVIDGVIYDRRNDSQELYVLAVYRKEKPAAMHLRAYEPADAAVICKWLRTEEELYKWSADRFSKYPLSGEDINESYAPQTAAGRFFPLTAADENDRIIGHFIIRYPRDDDDSTVRFGFVIMDPECRGRGCGKEMLRLGIQYVKTHFTAERIDLGVFANNESARRCYEAVGFRAYQTRRCELPVGTWDCTDMELLIERGKE